MSTEVTSGLAERAAVFAALSDPARLAIVDYLTNADASPSELRAILSMSSNLLAHHLAALRKAGVIRQTRSEADGRRTYLRLNHSALDGLVLSTEQRARRIVFVCTHNSARSQLAAAIWNRRSEVPATSAGTKPATQVHRGAVAAARRLNLSMRAIKPRYLGDVLAADDLVIAVCDNAHEELPPELPRIHWSVSDPTRSALATAFDETVGELTARIDHFIPTVQPA
jgi:ArsR family transcriptional regulator, arsenate/arsenite/antimonite-responsive transcriptional repressor / arsenate reductase (thioredoxin)